MQQTAATEIFDVFQAAHVSAIAHLLSAGRELKGTSAQARYCRASLHTGTPRVDLTSPLDDAALAMLDSEGFIAEPNKVATFWRGTAQIAMPPCELDIRAISAAEGFARFRPRRLTGKLYSTFVWQDAAFSKKTLNLTPTPRSAPPPDWGIKPPFRKPLLRGMPG